MVGSLKGIIRSLALWVVIVNGDLAGERTLVLEIPSPGDAGLHDDAFAVSAVTAGARQAVQDWLLQTGEPVILLERAGDALRMGVAGEGEISDLAMPMDPVTCLQTWEKAAGLAEDDLPMGIVLGAWQIEWLSALETWVPAAQAHREVVVTLVAEQASAWSGWQEARRQHPAVRRWLLLLMEPGLLRPPGDAYAPAEVDLWMVGAHPRLLEDVRRRLLRGVFQPRWYEAGYYHAEALLRDTAVVTLKAPAVITSRNIEVWQQRWSEWMP